MDWVLIGLVLVALGTIAYEGYKWYRFGTLPLVSPVPPDLVVEGDIWNSQNLAPLALPPDMQDLPDVSQERKSAAKDAFADLACEWATGFGDPEACQPDRLQLLKDFGLSKHVYPFLVLACRDAKSLQAVVREVLDTDDDRAEQIAANMAQIAHAGFPDLAITLNLTGRWRRPNEQLENRQ